MVAYLRDVHLSGVRHPGTVNQYPGSPVISIDGGEVFFKELPLYILATKFFQHLANVLACKVRPRKCKVRIVTFVPYLCMTACTFVCQQPVKDQRQDCIAFIRKRVFDAIIKRLPLEIFL